MTRQSREHYFVLFLFFRPTEYGRRYMSLYAHLYSSLMNLCPIVACVLPWLHIFRARYAVNIRSFIIVQKQIRKFVKTLPK
jgi:hypothetical protein